MIKNLIPHFKTILYHKKEVFKNMCMCGRPWQGFWHDMSKFSITELKESLKYYSGIESPINAARRDNGYSLCWLHHKGHNKHHGQYWIDLTNGNIVCVEMPWKYVVEFLCDGIAAGKTYCKNKNIKWTKENPYEHWIKADKNSFFNDKTRKLIDFYYKDIANRGWEAVAADIKLKGNYYNDWRNSNEN